MNDYVKSITLINLYELYIIIYFIIFKKMIFVIILSHVLHIILAKNKFWNISV